MQAKGGGKGRWEMGVENGSGKWEWKLRREMEMYALVAGWGKRWRL